MEITVPVVGEVSAQAWNNIENICKFIPEGKPPNLEANREIRFGPDNRFRVFYSVEQENRQVFILAIGVKRGNRLIIGREEVNLGKLHPLRKSKLILVKTTAS